MNIKRLYFLLQLFICSIILSAQTNVDTHIAVNDQQDPNTFVLIISNEHYTYEQPVPFALNDGAIFKLYCEKTLGVPPKNIRYAPDATLNDIRRQLMWLENVMKVYKGEARAIVYYSGHGMPSEKNKHAFLLPVDGDSRVAESGMSTEQLYKQLGKLPSRGTIVLLDACFSGARRDGQMLVSNHGVAIKVKDNPITGNMVVFSAAHGDETAYPYIEQRHGLFTYYLLSALQQSGGCISLGELSDQVTKMVTRKSLMENNKEQTPTINPSPAFGDWRSWMFADKPAPHIQVIKPQTFNDIKNEQSLSAEASSNDVKFFTVGNASFKMIRVDGGTFTMGATKEQGDDARKNEKPVHQVTLSPYYIGETEVTQELWEAVMGNNPSSYKGAKRPVENVSWDDCFDFIYKLSQKTGIFFRLPTEAEWEYAARGGSKSQSYKYSGSNTPSDVALYNDLLAYLYMSLVYGYKSQTQTVKAKQANELGLYDMSGNVWEWCQDWDGCYTSIPQTNPSGASSGSYRIIRGGGWSANESCCRVSYRNSASPGAKGDCIGFRLAFQ